MRNPPRSSKFKRKVEKNFVVSAAHIKLRLMVATLVVMLTSCAREKVDTDREEMTFNLVSIYEDYSVVYATGKITKNTPSRLDALLSSICDSNGVCRSNTVVLNSPGGNLLASLELGRTIRARKMYTAIAELEISDSGSVSSLEGNCSSGCAYAFLGGTSRRTGLYVSSGSVPNINKKDREGEIGIHQFSTSYVTQAYAQIDEETSRGLRDEEATQFYIAQLVEYLNEMDVDPRVFSYASKVSPEDLLVLSQEELLDFNVITVDIISWIYSEPMGLLSGNQASHLSEGPGTENFTPFVEGKFYCQLDERKQLLFNLRLEVNLDSVYGGESQSARLRTTTARGTPYLSADGSVFEIDRAYIEVQNSGRGDAKMVFKFVGTDEEWADIFNRTYTHLQVSATGLLVESYKRNPSINLHFDDIFKGGVTNIYREPDQCTRTYARTRVPLIGEVQDRNNAPRQRALSAQEVLNDAGLSEITFDYQDDGLNDIANVAVTKLGDLLRQQPRARVYIELYPGKREATTSSAATRLNFSRSENIKLALLKRGSENHQIKIVNNLQGDKDEGYASIRIR